MRGNSISIAWPRASRWRGAGPRPSRQRGAGPRPSRQRGAGPRPSRQRGARRPSYGAICAGADPASLVLVSLAWAGPSAVFAINAVSFTAIIFALTSWERPKQLAPLEREHFGHAIVSGLLYVSNARNFRRILLRTALFLFPASALLALLPVVAARRWHLGAGGYGVALGAIGFGAVLAS
jgi:hypothetical protein